VRLEDRQVEGKEFEKDLHREKSPLEDKRTQDLEGMGDDELRSTGRDRPERLLEVMREILENQGDVDLSRLGVSQREYRALEAIRVAVTAKSADTHQFVYAEDRRMMLEQALAVLQPDLISHDAKVVGEMQEQLASLTSKVTELREQLQSLEDGQGESLLREHVETKAEDSETDAKPADSDGDKKSSLYGPERKQAAKPASTLTGPEVKQEKPASTLTGPERKQPAAQPTSLGDADEIAAVAKKKPWWRRVIGG